MTSFLKIYNAFYSEKQNQELKIFCKHLSRFLLLIALGFFVILLNLMQSYALFYFDLDYLNISQYNNYIYFVNEYDYLLSFSDTLPIYVYTKVPTSNVQPLTPINWKDNYLFILPLHELKWREFSAYQIASKYIYNFVVLPEIYVSGNDYEKRQWFDGLIDDYITTAYALTFLKNNDSISKAINFLKLHRNDDLKCWPEKCRIDTTIMILYYLKRAGYDYLKIFSDAMVWLNSQLKSSEYTLNVLINPKSDLAICNISKISVKNLVINESYTFNTTYSNSPLDIVCDEPVYVVIQDQDYYRSFSGDDIHFNPQIGCFGSENRLDDCDSDINVYAKLLGFNVDFKPWIVEDEVIGKKLNTDNPFISSSLYFYYINHDMDIIQHFLYYQRNYGFWRDAKTTLFVLNALKLALHLQYKPEIEQAFYDGLIYLIEHYDELYENVENSLEELQIQDMLLNLFYASKPRVVVNEDVINISKKKSTILYLKSVDNRPVSVKMYSEHNTIEPKSFNFKNEINISLTPKNNLKSGTYYDFLILNLSYENQPFFYLNTYDFLPRKSQSRIVKIPLIMNVEPFLTLKSTKLNQNNNSVTLEFEKSNDELSCEVVNNDSLFVFPTRLVFNEPKIDIKYEVKQYPDRIENHRVRLDLICKIMQKQFTFSTNFTINVAPKVVFEFVNKNYTIYRSGRGNFKIKVKNLLNQNISAKVSLKDESFIFLKTYYVDFNPKETKEIELMYSIPEIENFTYKTFLVLSVNDVIEQFYPIYIDLNKSQKSSSHIFIILVVIIVLLFVFRKFVSEVLKFFIRIMPFQKYLPATIIDWAWSGKVKNPQLLKKITLKKERSVVEDIKELIEVMHSIGKPEYKIRNALKQKGFQDTEIDAAFEEFKKELAEKMKK